MLKMILGAGILVALVGFGVISTQDVQSAGDKVVTWSKEIKPMVNKAATSVVEATK